VRITRPAGKYPTTDASVYISSGLSNPPAVWNYVRSLHKKWDDLAKYLGYSEALISQIKEKGSWDTKGQIQDFMRVCLLPDCGEQRTEEIVGHIKRSSKIEPQSEYQFWHSHPD